MVGGGLRQEVRGFVQYQRGVKASSWTRIPHTQRDLEAADGAYVKRCNSRSQVGGHGDTAWLAIRRRRIVLIRQWISVKWDRR